MCPRTRQRIVSDYMTLRSPEDEDLVAELLHMLSHDAATRVITKWMDDQPSHDKEHIDGLESNHDRTMLERRS